MNRKYEIVNKRLKLKPTIKTCSICSKNIEIIQQQQQQILNLKRQNELMIFEQQEQAIETNFKQDITKLKEQFLELEKINKESLETIYEVDNQTPRVNKDIEELNNNLNNVKDKKYTPIIPLTP